MLRTRTPEGSLGFEVPLDVAFALALLLVKYSLGTLILKLTRLNNFTCVAAYELSVYASLWLFHGGTHVRPACKTRYKAPFERTTLVRLDLILEIRSHWLVEA